MSGVINQMIDDLWIDVFKFCPVVDFLHIRETCRKFSKITIETNPRINQYWQLLCKQLCSSIESSYKTKKWYEIYWELRKLLRDHGYIEKIDDKTHDIVVPEPPIKLTRYLKDSRSNPQKHSNNTSTNDHDDINPNSTCNKDDIPPILQFCAHGCVNLLDMRFYQQIKLQLQSNNINDNNIEINNIEDVMDNVDININQLQLNGKSDNCNELTLKDIVSNVINYRERSLNNGKWGNHCALFVASRVGTVNIVEYLLTTFGTIINIDNSNVVDRAPLFMASFFGHTKIIHLLLNHSTMTISHINKQDTKGFTSLFVAAQNGHFEIVQLLMQHGADVNIAEARSHTPLWIASLRGRNDIVECLIESNKVKNYDRCGMQTILYAAAQNNQWKCVELLTKSGKCDINLANDTGASPLWRAASMGCIESLKVLVEYGADVEQREKQV